MKNFVAASSFEGVKSCTERWLVKLPQGEWAERRESISKRSTQARASRTVQPHQRLVTYSQLKWESHGRIKKDK